MSEFVNSSQEKNPQAFAAWLIESRAKLDDSNGNVITKLTVEDPARKGSWSVALKGGIDMVDSTDLSFASERPADIGLTESLDHGTIIEVRHLGVDDELRRAEVDLSLDPQFIPEQTVQNS